MNTHELRGCLFPRGSLCIFASKSKSDPLMNLSKDSHPLVFTSEAGQVTTAPSSALL